MGIRIHDINISSTVNRNNTKLKVVPLWIEPIVGVRGELALKRWLFAISGDFGNLHVIRESSYMINTFVYFRISRLLSVKAGWTDWDIKYRDDYLDDELKLEVHLSGPSTALIFHF